MKEDEYDWISSIQHFAFCPRQWGLIALEGVWEENLLTVSGSILHEKVHQTNHEKRKNGITVRGMRVKSDIYRLQGQCDVVEFIPDKRDGIWIPRYGDYYRLYPVEYKKGKSKSDLSDSLQLAAQVVCLEEMLCCEISHACLFYFGVQRREQVTIGPELRQELKEILEKMQQYRMRNRIPRVKKSSKCRSCSLKEQCIPELDALEKASTYILRRLRE